MNRVYKVIWSKAKHCYVVTSEIARSVTKSASSARSAGRKGAAVLAMAALLFTAGGVLGEVAANVTDVTVNKPGNVITVTKDGGDPTPFTIDNVDNAKAAGYALKATADANGEVIHNTYAKVNTDGKVAKAVAADSAEQATKDGKGNEISSTYVKIANARVGADGEYVKKANTVGKNLSALDTNLSALDEQVKKNTKAVAGIVEAGEKVGEKLTDLDKQVKVNADAVAAEETARKQADQNNLKIEGDDGVISKVTGNDGTKSSAVNKLVLNKDDKNQITLSGDGIKVGLNSGVMDKDGFYAGGDDYDHAGAALKWDGSIKGANGDFTVDKDGNADIGGDLTVDKNLTVNGTFDSKTLSSTVVPDINYTTITGGKTVSMNQKNDVKTGETQASASTFDENGSNAWAKDDDSIGKSTVTADGISQKLSDTVDNPTVYAERTMSQGTDNKYSMVDTVKDGDKTNVASQTASESSSVVSGKDNESIIKQTETGIKSIATDGTNNASTNLSNNGFNTYASDGGKNKTYTKQTAESLTSQIGDDGKVMSVMNAEGISNNADGGTITNSAKDLVNTASENMTNTVDNNLTTTVGGNETRTVKGTLTETVTGNVTEDYKAGLSTKVGGNETHAVTGNQTVTVSKDRTVNVKGTETENFNAQVTNVKTDQQTSVGGNQTNIVTGDQQNTVSGSKTETVKGAVTEKYGSQATTVDKDLTTTVGGNETHAVTGNQTVTVSKDRTVNVKGTETENFNAQVTNVKTDQKTSVGGNQTNIVTGDQQNTISGNKTETVKGEVTEKYGSLTTEVKGESKLSAANITNRAKEKLSNSAAEIENSATKSITDKVGDNVERTMTTDQIQDKVGKTTVTTTDGWTKLTDEDHNHTTEMDYANVTKDLSVYRNTTLGEEGQDTILTVNSKSTFKDTVKMEKTLDVDGSTTLGKEGKDTTLTVNSTSTFKDTVKMEKTLDVDGESTFNNKVTIKKNGLAVTGGTTTDTLNVTGETRTGTLHVNGNGYVGGDLNVEGNIETHDAVLSADSRQVVTGRQLYQTNERVDRLDNRIKKVGANAAALAALRPGDFNPDDKFSIAAGFGSYRNANAAALGLFYRPNENVLLSLGTSFGDGENMVNAGVSVKFGRGKSMAERRKEMADEVSSMRDEMRSQDERIAELEEMLKKQSELIEKLSKES